MSKSRRVFDCCMYRGEIDVLTIRLHELNDIVDYFILVESNQTHTGISREISFNPSDPRISKFSHKIRHMIVDISETNDPWARDALQRNAIIQGVTDATPTDLIVISDIDEIPRATVIALMARDCVNEVFGVCLFLSYFYVNYRNVSGPESMRVWTVAATRSIFDFITPTGLREMFRVGKIEGRIFIEGGWHFSYLMDEIGIKQKLAAFTHQEYNTPEFINTIDIEKIVREGKDFLNRPNFNWKILPDCDLPVWLLENRSLLGHLFI